MLRFSHKIPGACFAVWLDRLCVCNCGLLCVACVQDVEKELKKKTGVTVQHMNYENYDGHRHPIKVVPGTPLWDWFRGREELNVNSYHHQVSWH